MPDGSPNPKELQAANLIRLMVLRYGLFLAYNGKLRRSEALVVAGLADPQLFALARAQYELLEEEVMIREWSPVDFG